MKMEFTKMHGTGNDYVYVNCMEQELPNPGAISEYISHRRFGIGSDGLIMICKSDVADFKMRIFNKLLANVQIKTFFDFFHHNITVR